MPNVHFDITADEERAVRAMVAVKRGASGSKEEAKKLAAELRKVANQFDRVGVKGKKAGQTAGSSMTALSGKVLAIAAPVAIAHKAITLYLQDAERLAKQATAAITDMIAAISGAGDLGQIKEVRQMLLSASAPGLGVQQRVGLYKAIRGDAPSAPLSEVKTMFEQAARGAKTGMNQQEVQEFGQTIASLRKLGIGETVQQTANVAKLATEAFGKRGGQFLRSGVGALSMFQKAGGDPMVGLAMMLSLMERGLRSEQLQTVVEQVSGLKPVPQQMGIPADAQTRISAIDAERDAMMERHETIRRERWEADRANEKQAMLEEGMSTPARRKSEEARTQRADALRMKTDEELETMRRREVALMREREALSKQRAPVPLAPEDAVRNRLAAMPFQERMLTLVQDPEAAKAISPQIALRAANASEKYEKFYKDMQLGLRMDVLSLRQDQRMADPASAELWYAQASRARTSVLEEKKYGQAVRERETLRAYTQETAIEEGASPITKWFNDMLAKAYGTYEIYHPDRDRIARVEVVNQPMKSPLGGGQEVRNKGNE